MKKTIFISVLAALLILSPAALAADGSYSTVIDSFTGQPVTGGSSGSSSDSDVAPLTNSSWYDLENHSFVFRLSTGGLVNCSVANGMVTTGSVYLSASEGVEMLLYRDGERVEVYGETEVSDVGAYVLNIAKGSTDEHVLTFTIVSPVTGAMAVFRMPENFVVDEVYLDQEQLPYEPYSVDLSQEGMYRITYLCVPTKIRYNLDIRVDHTAPVLALEAVVDGVAKGPVDISDLENGASIYIEHDGQPMDYAEKLLESGAYRIEIRDAAGNSNFYNFAIQVYFNINSIVFFILIVAVLLIAMIYVLRSRRKLRIR